MDNVDEYKARNAARETKQRGRQDNAERIRRESLPFWKQPDKVAKYTGYLQLYTLVLTIATCALVAATIKTAIILHSTDERIGEQVSSMQRQLSLMEFDQRPWVGIFKVKAPVPILPGQGFSAEITVKNGGKSPALNVRAFFESKFQGAKTFNEIQIPEGLKGSSSFLLPSQQIVYPMDISGDETQKAAEKQHGLLNIVGRIEYEDSIGNSLWTRFCQYYELDPSFRRLSTCEKGNDEGKK
jgi:hypothetical protein